MSTQNLYRSSDPVDEGRITAEDLGVSVGGAVTLKASTSAAMEVEEGDLGSQRVEELPPIADDHALLVAVREAIEDGYGGVILSGPPGTSKSWYAARIAKHIAGSRSRVWTVQFHAAYQYEDFIEGWVPDELGGFTRESKHLLKAAEAAIKSSEHLQVIVIDEISRADVPRVFGEALTYLEMSQRGRSFRLASGKVVQIPSNLFIIATMNPWDVSVDELDVALERRFAQIDMLPNEEELLQILGSNGVDEDVKAAAVNFFRFLQGRSSAMLHLGHAYFSRVKDAASLERLWRFQIRPHIRRVTRLDLAETKAIEAAWSTIVSAELKITSVPQGRTQGEA